MKNTISVLIESVTPEGVRTVTPIASNLTDETLARNVVIQAFQKSGNPLPNPFFQSGPKAGREGEAVVIHPVGNTEYPGLGAGTEYPSCAKLAAALRAAGLMKGAYNLPYIKLKTLRDQTTDPAKRIAFIGGVAFQYQKDFVDSQRD